MSETERQRPFDVNNRVVFAIAVPMTLAYLTTPLVGIVDTAVIGQLGSAAAIGGVAVGAIMFDLLFTTFNFLRASTTGLTAQALGANDLQAQKAHLYRACALAASSGLAIILLQVPIIALSIWAIAPSDEVAAFAHQYIAIRLLASPFGLLNYALLGWFLGLGRAKTGLALQAGVGLLNISFSVWFVLGLDMGIAGVAWASVLAEALVAMAGAATAAHQLGRGWKLPLAVIAEGKAIKRMFALNGDIMIRSFLLIATFAMFTRAGAQLGDDILAANAILMNFFLLSGYFLDGFATAAEQLAGRAIGARYRPAFDKAVKLCCQWGFILGLAMAVILFVLGPQLIAIMTSAPHVRLQAQDYLLWAAATPLTGVLAFQFDGVFIGATWSREMRNTMIISTLIFLGFLIGFADMLGNHALWLALNLFLLARGLSMLALLPDLRRRAYA